MELSFLPLSIGYVLVSLTMKIIGEALFYKTDLPAAPPSFPRKRKPDKAVSPRLILDPHFHGDDICGQQLIAYS
jgi:hypothetical protein